MSNPANFRIPRGYDVSRPGYQELSEGVRPEASAVPMEAYADLPPVRIDELHHDPIVLDAGTVVGMATGGLADGTLFPATAQTGGAPITLWHHSDGATWGLATASETSTLNALTGGAVKPLGMIFQPIYSFKLEDTHPNYKRVDSVGVVTDYLVQVPARSAEERALKAGDKVMVSKTASDYGHGVTSTLATLGTLQAWDGSTVADLEFVVGTCFQNLQFASDSGASAGDRVDADLANVALTTAGSAEFKGLERVQTVPGLGLSGSGTKGVPGWLLGARADGSGNFHALTILVRL